MIITIFSYSSIGKINYVGEETETLTIGRIIPPWTYSLPAEVSTPSNSSKTRIQHHSIFVVIDITSFHLSNLWNQCLSPLTLWVRIPFRRGVLDTTICDNIYFCQWLVVGRWFSPGTPVSSTNKTDRQDITELLLKVEINTIALTPNH